MKSLPMAYGPDMQDAKRFAFEAVETMRDVLSVAAGIVLFEAVRQRLT